MIDNIVYNFVTENDWQLNQTRTLDPYSLLQSNTLNQINTIYGDNIVLTGMGMMTIPPERIGTSSETSGIMKIIVRRGQVIKDKVLIQFKEDTEIYLPYSDQTFKNKVINNSLLVVVTYKYEKVVPANIAKIEVIEETDYDPELHLGLHRIFFDENGEISNEVCLITPKDNIIYEQILQELNSVTTSAIYNVLGELGSEGIGDLLGTYIRVKGTSISGYHTTDKYYLCRTLPKSTYNINTGESEINKNSLRVIATYNVDSKFYQNEYVLYIDPRTNEWRVNTQNISNDKSLMAYKVYHDLIVYDDTDNYYVYAKFRGDVKGGLEVYEILYDSDQVIPCNIIEQEPDANTQFKLFTVSDKTNLIDTNTYINNCLIWNESNDGHGSGLDADKLDGLEGSDYATDEEVAEIERKIYERIAELQADLDAVRKIAEDAIPKREKHNQNGGVAILTDSTGRYKDNYDPDADPESINTLTDSSEIGGVVPQSELYIYRMFGDENQEHSVEFTHTNVDPTGTKRINCEGHFHATKVYNPAFKDIAEVFEAESGCNRTNCAHKIMSLDCSSGVVRPCHTTDYAIIGVCSDTYGTLLGASEEEIDAKGNLIPIALCGTVWVELENTLEPDYPNNYLGCLVGPGANGKGRIISRMDNRVCVGMIVEYNPDNTKGSNLVKILVGSYFK